MSAGGAAEVYGVEQARPEARRVDARFWLILLLVVLAAVGLARGDFATNLLNGTTL